MSPVDRPLLRRLPLLLAAASWAFFVTFVASWYLPGFDPGSPSPVRTVSFGAAGAAFLLSPAAIIVGAVFLLRRTARGAALAGILLGLPLTLLIGYGLFVVFRCVGV